MAVGVCGGQQSEDPGGVKPLLLAACSHIRSLPVDLGWKFYSHSHSFAHLVETLQICGVKVYIRAVPVSRTAPL